MLAVNAFVEQKNRRVLEQFDEVAAIEKNLDPDI
jgi:hypothetical protein